MPKKVKYDTIRISALHSKDGNLDRASREVNRNVNSLHAWLERNTEKLIIYKKKGESIDEKWINKFLDERDSLICVAK